MKTVNYQVDIDEFVSLMVANVLWLCEGKGLEALNFKLSTND